MVGNSIISATVISDVATEPVGLTEFKEYAQITYTDDDVALTALLKTARLFLQNYTGRIFGTATIAVSFTHNGERPMSLPYGGGEFTALTYRRCRLNDWGNVLANTSDDWYFANGRFEGLEGHYVGEYTTSSVVTQDVKTAIMAQALHMRDNRDDVTKQRLISPLAAGLLAHLVPIC